MSHTVGPKGQVVIEKAIRDKLGIKPGWTAYQLIEDNHVIIYFYPPPDNRSLLGILANHTKNVPPIQDDEWADVKEQAWAAAVDEKIERWREQERENERAR